LKYNFLLKLPVGKLIRINYEKIDTYILKSLPQSHFKFKYSTFV
jgi:hypothetical protein